MTTCITDEELEFSNFFKENCQFWEQDGQSQNYLYKISRPFAK